MWMWGGTAATDIVLQYYRFLKWFTISQISCVCVKLTKTNYCSMDEQNGHHDIQKAQREKKYLLSITFIIFSLFIISRPQFMLFRNRNQWWVFPYELILSETQTALYTYFISNLGILSLNKLSIFATAGTHRIEVTVHYSLKPVLGINFTGSRVSSKYYNINSLNSSYFLLYIRQILRFIYLFSVI